MAVFLACAGFNLARAENIILILKNGDKITGTVVSEYTNRVVLSNSWVKDLSVPLAEIDRRETALVAGTTNLVPSTNALAKIKAAKVVPATPPPLFKYWKAEAEVGLDLVYSTSDQQTYHGKFKLSYERPYASNPKNFFRNTLEYGVDYGKTSQTTGGTNVTVTSTDQMGATDKTSADFDRHWYAYNLAGVGYDKIRGIDLHVEEGPGLGYHLITLTNFIVNTEGGLNYQIQNNTDGTRNRDFFYRLAEDATWKLNPRTTIGEKAEFFPRVNFTEYRLRAEATLSYNLWRYVYWNTTVKESYDSRPVAGTKPNELEIHSALGVKF